MDPKLVARQLFHGIALGFFGVMMVPVATGASDDAELARITIRARVPAEPGMGAPGTLFGAPPPGTTATTSHFPSSQVKCWGKDCFPLPGGCNGTSDTITVTGLADATWDIDLTVFVRHLFNDSLTFTLTSPSGSAVLIARRRGGSAPDGYNGAVFDDSAALLVTDHFPGATFPPVEPEGALGQFIGENPNGVWTLTIFDNLNCGFLKASYLDAWSLDITTLDTVLTPSTVQGTDTTVMPIPNPGSVPSTLAISGAGASICDVNVITTIEHDYCADLVISLTSPAGTTVLLDTQNGLNLDDLFLGTRWDDQAIPHAVTTYPFSNGMLATPLVGEGKLSRLIGEDPNGTWTLTVQDASDHAEANSGTLLGWSLEITTCTTPGTGYCFGDGLDPVVTAQCPCGNFGSRTHGCANSSFALGGRLFATGTTNPNTILFQLRNVPNNNLATGFMNTANANPAGVVFGDGVRCQSGTLIRFGSHNTGTLGDTANTWSAAAFFVPPGFTRFYQVQYRNPAPAFCPPATFNVSNGYQVSW